MRGSLAASAKRVFEIAATSVTSSASGRRLLILVLAVGSLVVIPASSVASPPSAARIDLAEGMAGVRLHQAVEVGSNGTRLLGDGLSDWGPVDGFCFEADSCSWKVPGGGDVFVTLSPPYRGRVLDLGTTAPAWLTSRGIGPGAKENAVRKAYSGVESERVCLRPYGRSFTGLVRRHRRATTIFIIKSGRVTEIRLLAYRYKRGSGC